MITMVQALSADTFHQNGCKRVTGQRGGITLTQYSFRRSGATQLWKRHPAEFSVPVKYGMYRSYRINDGNAHLYHVAAECPLIQ